MATTQITWNWGTNTNINFNPATDVLDFGWFQGGQFTISEVNGAVVVAIPSNQQSYTLQHTTLHDLHLNNIVAKDASAISAWGRRRSLTRRSRRPSRLHLQCRQHRRPQSRRATPRPGRRAASISPACW